MTWDEYYEKFYDWATSTQIRRLSVLAPGRNSHFGCNRNRQFELR